MTRAEDKNRHTQDQYLDVVRRLTIQQMSIDQAKPITVPHPFHLLSLCEEMYILTEEKLKRKIKLTREIKEKLN